MIIYKPLGCYIYIYIYMYTYNKENLIFHGISHGFPILPGIFYGFPMDFPWRRPPVKVNYQAFPVPPGPAPMLMVKGSVRLTLRPSRGGWMGETSINLCYYHPYGLDFITKKSPLFGSILGIFGVPHIWLVVYPMTDPYVWYIWIHIDHQYTPVLLAYIPYMDPMGMDWILSGKNPSIWIYFGDFWGTPYLVGGFGCHFSHVPNKILGC